MRKNRCIKTSREGDELIIFSYQHNFKRKQERRRSSKDNLDLGEFLLTVQPLIV